MVGERPAIGAEVCLVPVVPARGPQCGKVDSFDSIPGDVFHQATTKPGNSGSGVYDADGRLVGIVTHYRRPPAQGGAFSSLADRRWLLE